MRISDWSSDVCSSDLQLRRLRIHTRLPVVLPERVDGELTAWLRALPWPVAAAVHANHANEFDTAVDVAMARLRDAGAIVLNQDVPLRGVNDSEAALADRSQEHTSELQSPIRKTYSDLCLTKTT